MKMKVSLDTFRYMVCKDKEGKNVFSLSGLATLYYHLSYMEKQKGVEINLDIPALCSAWREMDYTECMEAYKMPVSVCMEHFDMLPIPGTDRYLVKDRDLWEE